MRLRILLVASVLAAVPLLAHAEHANIKLRVYRVDPDSGKTRDEADAVADEEPPAGGINPRPVFKVKRDEPLVLQFILTNAYPHGELKNVTVRYFVVREDKAGQKKVPDLAQGTVTQGSFQLNLKPKARVGARVGFTIAEPGIYLLRVDTSNTKSDHEHFSAIDVQVGNSLAALGMVLGLAGVVVAAQCLAATGEKRGELPPFLEDFRGTGKVHELPPFLDEFFADRETRLVAREVQFPSAVGPVQAYWARPDRAQPLPAVLLVYDQEAWTDWMKTNTRHLASIGYEVVAVNVERRRLAAAKTAGASDTDEATLAELAGAVRWLRGRAEVLPNRLGVVGWGWSGRQTLALAAAMPVQACVVCDAALPNETGAVLGLRETAVLGVFGAAATASAKELPMFRKLLAAHAIIGKFHIADGVGAGFLGPPASKAYAHDAAEDAWFAIYNFLEKYVEDARPNGPAVEPAISLKPIATIADIMRVVNEPAGLRGALSKALEQEPKNARQWGKVRAEAALVAEAGIWLQMRTPAKGPIAHWQKQARAFTAAAETLVDAAERQDYGAAQRGLVLIAEQCATCHDEHR